VHQVAEHNTRDTASKIFRIARSTVVGHIFGLARAGGLASFLSRNA
jgi:hypothetical protein